MENIFEPLGFNPFDLIKDYNVFFLRDEINPLKYKEPDSNYKKLYNRRFAPKLDELSNSCSLKSRDELIQIRIQYEFIKDCILVEYYDSDGNSPEPNYIDYKKLSFNGLVISFLEDAINLINEFILNPTVVLVDSEINKMGLKSLKEYFNTLELTNIIREELTSDFILDNLFCLTEPVIKNRKEIICLSKIDLVKFILKGFYGKYPDEKIVLQKHSTKSTKFREMYHGFWKNAYFNNKVPNKEYKKILVQVLINCFSNIEPNGLISLTKKICEIPKRKKKQ